MGDLTGDGDAAVFNLILVAGRPARDPGSRDENGLVVVIRGG
jgi:hypothetical protein